MLSPVKPGEKFNAITDTFVFHCACEQPRFTIIAHCTDAVTCADALQYVDAILTLLHFFVTEVAHIIYIHTNVSSESDCHCQDYLIHNKPLRVSDSHGDMVYWRGKADSICQELSQPPRHSYSSLST